MALSIAGSNVEDPMPIWRGYALCYPRTIREYDLGGRGDPNHLTADEAWRSRIINSRLTRSECAELIARAAEPRCPWRDVPDGADLSGADPDVRGGAFDKAASLYWYFIWPERIHGVGVAKIHKILHVKRPDLYPIFDIRVWELYRDTAKEWVNKLSRLEVGIDDSPPYWAAARRDLVCNEVRLEAYRHELAADDDRTIALMAQLTKLRLQDIVAWQMAG